MKPCLFLFFPLVCSAVITMRGQVMGGSPATEPDFGLEEPWQQRDIALVRVASVRGTGEENATVVLRTERSYTDAKDTAERTVRLSAISFGYERVEGSEFPRKKPVSLEAGDELVVWPGHSPARRDIPAKKIVGEPGKSPFIRTLEQISKLREAGGRGPGLGFSDEIERIAKLRDSGGEAALNRAAATDDSTVVRYALSVLETFQPKKSDDRFADQLRGIRADAARLMSVRLSANRLLPRYAAAQAEAVADAANWPRTLFAGRELSSKDDLRLLADEIAATFSKREDRAAYFASIIADETKPRLARLASATVLTEGEGFDFEHPASQTSSGVFSATLSLLTSKDMEIRKAAGEFPLSVCDGIRTREDQRIRAKQAISAIDAAIKEEADPGVRDSMDSARFFLESFVK